MQLVLETPKSRIDGYKGWLLHFNVMFDLWKIFQYLEEIRFLRKYTDTSLLLFT